MNTDTFKKFIKDLFSVIIVPGVLILGAFWLPAQLIGSGVESFHGEERVFAQHSLVDTRELIGGSLEPLMVTAMKVESVQRVREVHESAHVSYPCMTTSGDDYRFQTKNSYEARVRLYTVFGFHYKTVLVTCAGASI